MKQEIKIIALWIVATLIVFAVGLWIFGLWHNRWSGYSASLSISDGLCNIAVIPITGDIISYAGADQDGSWSEMPPSTNADEVLATLYKAENETNILGIFVRIDSSGGSAVASEIISNGFKRSLLPVATFIREGANSGAYLAATGANTIIASSFSEIGSIGVNMSYLDKTAKNAKDGLQYIQLTSARFKDYGDPDKPLTFSERSLLERDLKIYHDHFVKMVSENRNLPIEQVAKLADGSSMPGSLALKNGLIDSLGDQETARDWFAEKLEISPKEVIFCE